MSRRLPVIVMLLCLPVVFLFAKMPPPEQSAECLRQVTIGAHAHFIHICDSYSITSEAQNLERYATQSNPWSARPFYIVTAAALASALSPVATLVRAVLERHIGGNFKEKDFLQRFQIYFALATINVLFLALALTIAWRLCGSQTQILSVALAAAIATSDLVHGLFWSQHPSFFNILVAPACIFYFVQGCRARHLRQPEIAMFGLAAGAGILVYAFAVIWLPAFVLGALFQDWRAATRPSEAASGLLRLLPVFAMTGCGPVLFWLLANTFYFHVTTTYEAGACGQFIWLAQAWRDGAILSAMAQKWHEFFPQVFLWQSWPGLFALCSCAVLAIFGYRLATPVRYFRDPILAGVCVSCASILLFNYFQGYFQPRLVCGMTLALFVAISRLSQIAKLEILGAILLILVSLVQIALAFIYPAVTMT